MRSFGAYDGKNVLITGGLGFIGSNLCHELVKLGANVTIIDCLLEASGANHFNIHDIKDKVKVEEVDLRKKDDVLRVVKSFDYVFHLAGQIGHLESMNNPQEDLELNALATLNLLEAIKKNCPKAKVIYSGSRSQYGKIQYNPVDEKHPILPTDCNGVSKQAAEQYVMLYNKAYGISSASLRLTNIYGPRVQIKNSKQGFIGWFIRQAIAGDTIKIFGDGKQLRDVLHVDDVCSCLLLVGISDEANGEVYNIGSGRGTSLIDVTKQIIKNAGSGKYELVAFKEEQKKIEIGDYIANAKKIEKLGWKPKVKIEQGLKATVEFYKKNKEHYW
jgi:UDP-glucose 4-epimerase